MRLLTRDELNASLAQAGGDNIHLDPLLRPDQVGAVSIDLRLGYDFLVSVLTRSPAIELRTSKAKRSARTPATARSQGIHCVSFCRCTPTLVSRTVLSCTVPIRRRAAVA